jgi:hypothetical protein
MAGKSRNAVVPLREGYDSTSRSLAEQEDGSGASPPPGIAVTMSEPDETGQRTARVVLQISDQGEFNASIGGESEAYTKGMLDSVCYLANEGDAIVEKQANFALSIVRGLHPRDQVEGLLGAQMAAIHIATMRIAAKLGRAKNREIADQHERALNRLTRTFAAQVEALKRYRSKGEQRVYVERVTVNEGGQAMVGVVERGEGA